MSIKMNDHDLTDEKKKELEKLSENLIPFEHELVDQTESLEEKISDLESTIEDLETDVENEKERADIAVDEADQARKDHEFLENRVNEVISWLSSLKKDQSIEDIIEQLEWALIPRSEAEESDDET